MAEILGLSLNPSRIEWIDSAEYVTRLYINNEPPQYY
jgi:hypothetical protein